MSSSNAQAIAPDHTARPSTAESSSPSTTSHTTQATTPPSHPSTSPPAAQPPTTEDEMIPQPTDDNEPSNADPSDLPALRRQHLTTGYRAGVTAGKSDGTVAQQAFDAGYAQGAAAGARAGWVLAMVQAVGEADEAGAAAGELVVGEFVGCGAVDGARWAALERWSARVAELGRERGLELVYPGG